MAMFPSLKVLVPLLGCLAVGASVLPRNNSSQKVEVNSVPVLKLADPIVIQVPPTGIPQHDHEEISNRIDRLDTRFANLLWWLAEKETPTAPVGVPAPEVSIGSVQITCEFPVNTKGHEVTLESNQFNQLVSKIENIPVKVIVTGDNPAEPATPTTPKSIFALVASGEKREAHIDDPPIVLRLKRFGKSPNSTPVISNLEVLTHDWKPLTSKETLLLGESLSVTSGGKHYRLTFSRVLPVNLFAGSLALDRLGLITIEEVP